MEYYVKRKAEREKVLENDAKRLSDKLKFIELVISGSIKLFGRSKVDLRQGLTKAGFGSGYPIYCSFFFGFCFTFFCFFLFLMV